MVIVVVVVMVVIVVVVGVGVVCHLPSRYICPFPAGLAMAPKAYTMFDEQSAWMVQIVGKLEPKMFGYPFRYVPP